VRNIFPPVLILLIGSSLSLAGPRLAYYFQLKSQYPEGKRGASRSSYQGFRGEFEETVDMFGIRGPSALDTVSATLKCRKNKNE
jgi:hypothetical protein